MLNAKKHIFFIFLLLLNLSICFAITANDDYYETEINQAMAAASEYYDNPTINENDTYEDSLRSDCNPFYGCYLYIDEISLISNVNNGTLLFANGTFDSIMDINVLSDLSISRIGDFIYQPDECFEGIDTFVYSITYENSETDLLYDEATVTINISGGENNCAEKAICKDDGGDFINNECIYPVSTLDVACQSMSEAVYDSFSLGIIAIIVLVVALIIGVLMFGFGENLQFDMASIGATITLVILSVLMFIIGVVVYAKVSGAIC